MNNRSKLFYCLIFMALTVAMNGCRGGDGTQNKSGQSGRLTQGPVVNATVWADDIDKGVRFKMDPEEVAYSTKTDPVTGDFTLPPVPYNYVLVSLGGTDRLTGQAAIQMIAPAGSANITPLTTLVAMDTTGTVQAKLEALMPGIKFDTDISVTASPAALMVSKSVETVVTAMTTAINTNSANTVSAAQISSIQAQAMQNITEEFAKPSVTATTLSAPANLTTSLQTAATASVASINTAGNITIPAATATTIASSSVSATTTALSIGTSASTATITGGESALITPAVAAALNTATAAVVTEAKTTITAVVTPPAYVAPPIQVVTPIYVAPPLGSQTIGNISFNPATLNIGTTTTASAVATSGLPVVFKSASPSVCSVSGTTVTGIADGMCLISANQTGSSSYSAARQEQTYITIRANQSIGAISFSPATLNVGGVITAAAQATSGLEVTFNSATPAVCTVNEVDGKTITGISAGTCTISADQIGTTNYVSALQVKRNIDVLKNNQSITVGTMPPIGGATVGNTFSVAATAPAGTVIYSSGSPSICSNTNGGATFTMNAAGICTVLYDQGGNSVYSAAAQISATTSGIKQNQSIVFSATQSTLNMGDTTTVSAGASSGLDVDFSTASAACTVSSNVVTPVASGVCVITASQAGNVRYNAAPSVDSTTITVSKKSQNITVATSAPATALVGSSFTVDATAPGGTVSYSSSGSCSNSAGTFTINSSGTCTVMYDSPATNLYSAAPQVTNTTISKKLSQAISVITYTAGGATTTLSATAPGGPVIFSTTTPNVCTATGVNGATITAIGGGTCTIAANQAGSTQYSIANTRFQDINIKVIPPSYTGGNSTFIF